MLSLVLAAEPCQRVVVVPLEPVATTAARARSVEEEARALLARAPGACVEPRAETVKRLLALEGQRLPACRDAACASAQRAAFQADVLVHGLVLGVGGKDTVDLTITRAAGASRAVGERSELPALLSLSAPLPGEAPRRGSKWPAFVAAGFAAGALGTGVGLGVSAKGREQALSAGAVCEGALAAACLDAQLAQGKGEATAANVLFGVGGALLIGATVLFLVELP